MISAGVLERFFFAEATLSHMMEDHRPRPGRPGLCSGEEV